MDEVQIWTDGARKGTGRGGWGAVLVWEDVTHEIFGGEDDTTNNRMELMAAVEALDYLTRPCIITLHSDSQYVVKGASEWIPGWVRRGWRTKEGEDVKNADLWLDLIDVMAGHDILWQWVRGHNGNVNNERADVLANKGCKGL